MTMGFNGDGDGDPTAGQTEEAVDTVEDEMELEETPEAVVEHMEKNSGSTLLQKEAARTSTTMTTTPTKMTKTKTGMKKIDDEDEEEEEGELLGMKTRNWRKINLSYTVVLDGQDIEDIRAPDQLQEGNIMTTR
jgi:hypothetical protein